MRARVLLTTPLESFTVGHTIVVSRGLLDVLPDEASLAMVLAHELGHIALGHRLDTKYAFGDRMVFPDEETFRRIQLARDPHQEEAADQKAVEFLQNSPYKDKLADAGLFLRALEARSKQLPALITPQFGSRMAKGDSVLRMSALLQSAPALKTTDVTQIAALPLGQPHQARSLGRPRRDEQEQARASAVGPRQDGVRGNAHDSAPCALQGFQQQVANRRQQ